MKKLFADLVQESTTTTGTGTVTLAQMTGWVRFSDRFSVNDRVYYSIRSGDNWEVGFGTLGSSNTLARTSIIGSYVAGVWTSGGSPISLAGTSTVRAVAPESFLTTLWKVEYAAVAVNSTLVEGFAYAVTASSLTLTLPATPGVGDRVSIFQGGSGITGTIVNPNGEKICGVSGNMTVDLDQFSFSFVYLGSSYGWRILA